MAALNDNDNDLLDILREELETAIRAIGINERAARDLVASYIERVQLRAGGSRYWIRHRRDMLRRLEEVVSAFTGRNHEEVCERFGITRRTLRRYLAYAKREQGPRGQDCGIDCPPKRTLMP